MQIEKPFDDEPNTLCVVSDKGPKSCLTIKELRDFCDELISAGFGDAETETASEGGYVRNGLGNEVWIHQDKNGKTVCVWEGDDGY